MRVNVAELTTAIQEINSLAALDKQPAGIMFDIHGDIVGVCYSNGRRSIIHKLVVVPDEGDTVQSQIILNYERLLATIGMCKPSNGIYTEDMYISFDADNKQMIIEADKFMKVRRLAGTDDSGEVIYNEESKRVSSINQKLGFNYPSDGIKYQLSSRMDYDSIFAVEVDDCDIWRVSDLRNTLNALAMEKNSVVYLSTVTHTAFVNTLSFTKELPIDDNLTQGLCLHSQFAKALVDVLNKVKDPDEGVLVHRDGKYASISDTSETLGIWFEIAPPNKTHMASLQAYTIKEYTNYSLVFSKGALIDALKNAIDTTKDAKLDMTFVEVGTEVYAQLTVNSPSMATFSDFNILLEGQNDYEKLKDLKIPISLKVMSDMVSGCDSYYIGIDIELGDNDQKFIRVAELTRDENGDKQYGAKHYSICK